VTREQLREVWQEQVFRLPTQTLVNAAVLVANAGKLPIVDADRRRKAAERQIPSSGMRLGHRHNQMRQGSMHAQDFPLNRVDRSGEIPGTVSRESLCKLEVGAEPCIPGRQFCADGALDQGRRAFPVFGTNGSNEASASHFLTKSRVGARFESPKEEIDQASMFEEIVGSSAPLRRVLGNIRELQNVIERAVILCDGDVLAVDETWLPRDQPPRSQQSGPLVTSLINQERQLIESALSNCRGRVSGESGAAVKLGIPRSTLESKIRSLQIDKHRFRSR